MKVFLSLGALTLALADEPTSVLKSSVRRHENKRQEHHNGGHQLRDMYSFYHTSDQLKNEAEQLVKSCGDAKMWTVNEDDVSIDVIRVKSSKPDPSNRVFLMFGEHSRELISPESGLALLKLLCGGGDSSQRKLVEDTLKDSEFQMVLNANPRSRKQVDNGDLCIRTNPAGVDLNRNWDEDWQKDPAGFGADSFPGPKPFSEPETRLLKSVVEDYNPTTYLTVHSGTLGMYMPWAYDMKHLADRNQKPMLSILEELDDDHCDCPFGAAGKEVGYNCPGTSLDWVYDKLKTPFSFAFEIWVDEASQADLRARWERMRPQHDGSLGEGFSSLLQVNFESDFVGSSSSMSKKAQTSWDCFRQYNPITQDTYTKTVDTWAQAYLQMAQKVVERMKDGDGANHSGEDGDGANHSGEEGAKKND